MGSRRFLIGTAMAAAATAAGAFGISGSAPPTALAAATVPTVALPPVMRLQQFRTPGNAGYFYTLNPTEAASAKDKFKFIPDGSVATMRTGGGPGTTAVHRLHAKTGASYMLSISPNEIHSPQFVDEGVVGYVDGGPKPGEQRLLRFSNQGQWRVALETAKPTGFHEDGPIGWVHP